MEPEQEKTTSGEVVSQTNDKAIVPRSEEALQVEMLIAKAIDKKVPVESMERILAMRRELKAEFAKKEFDRAMSLFQGDCPVITKSKSAMDNGKVLYKYAPLDAIVAQTKDLIRQNGFSYSIKTQTNEKGVKVWCIVKHEAGHEESTDVEVPLGKQTSIMSASQVVASALTFAKRYAFCNAFGILTGDEDDDATATKALETKAPMKNNTPAPAKDWKNETVKTPEQGMVVVYKSLISASKSKDDLFKVAEQIEDSKKQGKLSGSDISVLRGLFQEKQKALT